MSAEYVDSIPIYDHQRYAARFVTRNYLGYNIGVIKSFKHRGLERFYRHGSTARIKNEQTKRIRLILGRLDASGEPRDMNLPGLKLHELKGGRKGTWSVWVNGNWRVTFRFDGPNAVDVDYEDYH